MAPAGDGAFISGTDVIRFTPGATLTRASGSNNQLTPLALDSAGDVYFTDSGDYDSSINSDRGYIYRSKPSGGFEGVAPETIFGFIRSLAIDTSDNLFVTDRSFIRKITPGGTVSLVSDDIVQPTSLAIDPVGNLFVKDFDGVFEFSPAGVPNLIVPGGALYASGTVAYPAYLAAAAGGVVYLSDLENHVILETTVP